MLAIFYGISFLSILMPKDMSALIVKDPKSIVCLDQNSHGQTKKPEKFPMTMKSFSQEAMLNHERNFRTDKTVIKFQKNDTFFVDDITSTNLQTVFTEPTPQNFSVPATLDSNVSSKIRKKRSSRYPRVRKRRKMSKSKIPYIFGNVSMVNI